MTDSGDTDEAIATRKKTRSGAICVGLGAVLLVLGILAYTLVVAPLLNARDLMRKYAPYGKNDAHCVIESLGGQDKAVGIMSLYLKMPRGFCPKQWAAIQVLAECGENATPIIVSALRHDDVDVRKSAISTLIRSGKPIRKDALQMAVSCLNDADTVVGDRIALFVGSAGKDAVPMLDRIVEHLLDPNPQVRVQALFAIELLGKQAGAARAKVLAATNDPDESVRLQAGITLERLGKE
jgi:HEAT repeat protein